MNPTGLVQLCLFAVLAGRLSAASPPSRQFHFGRGDAGAGFVRVSPTTFHDSARGHGFLEMPVSEHGPVSVFAVDVEEGNYTVTIRFGDADHPTSSVIKAESRRLMLEQVATKAGEFVTRSFTVNVRTPRISADRVTKLNSRETGPPMHPNWDNLLTLEINGPRPGLDSMVIRPASDALTVFVAGDSTVTDQRNEPYAGWGQMLPRFFGPGVAVSNHAESGLALRSFESQRRLEKLLGMMRPGDYLLIQFGHNDQKDKRAGAGPFTTYRADLIGFVEKVRALGGIPVLITPMERLRMDEQGRQTPTLADYAEAVRQVGTERDVPVIDLNAMSLKFYGALGPRRSTRAFAFYPAKTFPGQEQALKDRTHHNVYGAYELARCVVDGIRRRVPALAARLSADAGGFDPELPDDPDAFSIPRSPMRQPPRKPAGN